MIFCSSHLGTKLVQNHPHAIKRMASAPDYYKVLGVSKDAPDVEIKTKYKKLAFQHHPDKNAGSKQAEEKFKEVQEAYETLTDPEKRSIYERCQKMINK